MRGNQPQFHACRFRIVNTPRVLVLLGALAFTAVVCVATEVTPDNRGTRYDAAFYAAMAGHPQIEPVYLAHVGPSAYRVAIPAVAARLPWDTFTNFRVLSFVSTVATLFLMFLILEQLGFAASRCAAGVVLYTCVFWAVRFACYAPVYIDAETQLMLLAIIYLTIRDHYLALIPVMIIAVLVKESLAACLLFTAVRLHRQHTGQVNTRTGLIVAALVIAPLLAIGVVRTLVTTVSAVDTGAEVPEQLRLLMTPSSWAVLLHALFSGLGLLPFVIALRARRALAFAREHYEWIAYVLTAAVLIWWARQRPAVAVYAAGDDRVHRTGNRRSRGLESRSARTGMARCADRRARVHRQLSDTDWLSAGISREAGARACRRSPSAIPVEESRHYRGLHRADVGAAAAATPAVDAVIRPTAQPPAPPAHTPSRVRECVCAPMSCV